MPRTRKPKYLDEVLEADFIRKIDTGTSSLNTWQARSEYLKNISELKSYVTKGYSLREWDKVFNILLKEINISGYESKGIFDLVYNYCRNSIKSRLPIEQEVAFLSKASGHWRGSSTVYKYAKYVVKGKLSEEVESSLNLATCMKYVCWLKENNFPFEPLLIRSTRLAREFYITFSHLPDDAHNFMLASKIGGDQVAVEYFRDKEKFDHFLMGALSNVDQTQTIKEFLEKISK
jgi:hypothetical protein